eukprot:CAMPEP_0183568824 /NCGR_PEP_ID=MMETSP0371-20130417/118507_1 /TAXON_ID=268820 /ORGANISM="Peridinium aciculiferum, Strain PAER-2" /LENGTH=80 /DNA_ID=CAMNT_0025778359 /DNA_START=36 /DNA_END=274 /DNA_ORIENTATION=-
MLARHWPATLDLGLPPRPGADGDCTFARPWAERAQRHGRVASRLAVAAGLAAAFSALCFALLAGGSYWLWWWSLRSLDLT